MTIKLNQRNERRIVKEAKWQSTTPTLLANQMISEVIAIRIAKDRKMNLRLREAGNIEKQLGPKWKSHSKALKSLGIKL